MMKMKIMKVNNCIYTIGVIIILISRAETHSGYSYADCTYVKPDYASTYYGGRCFCYTSPAIKWRDYWSTFQVQISGRDDVVIVYPMEPRTCHDEENLLKLLTCAMEHYWPISVQTETSADIPLVEEEVFFMAKSLRPSTEYKLHVSKHRFNRMRFFLFVSGLLIFFFAAAVCRSSVFFYIGGITLGMASIFLFLLLVLRKFISTLWFLLLFTIVSGVSYLFFQKLISDRDEMMRLYWRELLGYVLVSGLVSFAVCYRVGPIVSRRVLTVMTWALQAVGVALACHGVTYASVSWILLAVLLGFKVLPLLLSLMLAIWSQTFWLLSAFLSLFQRRRSSKSRLLTEAEYREQKERHTKSSLEELRRYCNKPGFPAWDTVLRLRSPQRFAEFLQNGIHITPSEVQNHERYHAFGFTNDENTLLDSTRTTSEDFSDHEISTHTCQSPNLNPSSPVPTHSAMPVPTVYVPSVCPYPPMPYTPVPERPLTDDDEPF